MENKAQKRTIASKFIRHKGITFICLAVAITGAAAYIYTAPVQYKSTLTLQSHEKNQQTTVNILKYSSKTAATELLTSKNYLTQALSKEEPWVAYFVEKDFRITPANYESPFIATCKIDSKNFIEQRFEIALNSANDYTLITENHGLRRVKQGKIGEELYHNGVRLMVNLKNPQPYSSAPTITTTKYYFDVYSPAAIASHLSANNIKATEENGVIDLICKHPSPEIAVNAGNQIASFYLNPNQDNSLAKSSQTNSIEQKIEELGSQLQTKEAVIAAYKSANQITEINNDAQKSLNILEEQQLQKSQLELQMASLDNMSNYLRKNRTGNNSLVEYGAINDPVFNEQIQQLNQKYQTAADPNISDPAIESLKNQIAERILNTRKRIAIQIEAVDKQIASTKSQLALIPGKAQSLEALERSILLDKKVYELLVEKRAKAIVDGGFIATGSSLIKPAPAQPTPITPNPWVVYSLAILAGSIASFILGSLLDILRSKRIHNRAELDELSSIPFIGNIVMDRKDPLPLRESFNNLCTKLLMKPGIKTITITSTNQGEGKTFIASHLAQSYSSIDKKVLLIDLNQHNPEIAKLYDITPQHSMMDVLLGRVDIHDAVCLTSFPNLDILVAGEMPEGVNTILASGKQEQMMNELKKHYDLIIIDTPESMNNIDAIPLMKLSDLTLYVAKAKSTRRESLLNAELIRKDYQIENMFFILNSITKPDTHTGKTGRGTYRKMNRSGNQSVKVDYVPAVLRKIALWFY